MRFYEKYLDVQVTSDSTNEHTGNDHNGGFSTTRGAAGHMDGGGRKLFVYLC